MTTLPLTSKPAPTHHNGGSFSPKTAAPRTAVTKKLVDVLMMFTWTADGDKDSARVNSPHIMLLKRKKRIKTPCEEVSL